MRWRSPLAWAAAAAALVALICLCNQEVLRAWRLAGRSRRTLRLTRPRPAGPPRGYVYGYHSGVVPFPMLALGERRLPGCPGGPGSPPYVAVQRGGRLGNLVLEYASVWALAREHGLPAFVPDEVLQRLKEVFEGLSVPPAGLVLGSDPECAAAAPQSPTEPWRAWAALEPVDLARVPLGTAVKAAYTRRKLIVLDLCSILPEAVVPQAAALRRELRLRPLLRRAAHVTLSRLRGRLLPREKQVAFVGVHARRTDYGSQLRLLYNVSQPAGPDYFVSAARWLQLRLQEAARPGPPPAMLLVVISDDPDWAQEVLVPALRAAGAGARGGPGWRAAWAGSGDLLRPERDLAVLAACNHTVFAYGTFGLTAALLAGGLTAVYRLAERPGHPALLTPAEQFARNLPGWAPLR